MRWRGDNKKKTELRFNNITPIFHSRLIEDTGIECCCGRSLDINSEIYVFKVTPKKEGGRVAFIHAGHSCGRKLIEFSNQINGTNYLNIYFMDPLRGNNEEAIVRGYGLRNYSEQNNINRYSQFNKTYLVSIFILCHTWNQPFPYGKLAETIDNIHLDPEVDYHDGLNDFNRIIGKDGSQRKLLEMLELYQEDHPNAFEQVNFQLLHNYIVNELNLESNIMSVV